MTAQLSADLDLVTGRSTENAGDSVTFVGPHPFVTHRLETSVGIPARSGAVGAVTFHNRRGGPDQDRRQAAPWPSTAPTYLCVTRPPTTDPTSSTPKPTSGPQRHIDPCGPAGPVPPQHTRWPDPRLAPAARSDPDGAVDCEADGD